METNTLKTVNFDLQQDKTLEIIREESIRDNKIIEPVLDKILTILSEEIQSDNEFQVKHGLLLAGRALVYLSQALCKDEAMFTEELDKSQTLAIDRIVSSIMPKVEDGKIVEEGYDLENLSIRRIMMALGTAVDYVMWRTEMSHYQDLRKDEEVQEEVAKQQ